MSRRGTTVVAWMIGLGALAGQAVITPVATAVLRDRAHAPVEVTLPTIEVRVPVGMVPGLPIEPRLPGMGPMELRLDAARMRHAVHASHAVHAGHAGDAGYAI